MELSHGRGDAAISRYGLTSDTKNLKSIDTFILCSDI